MSDAYGCGVTLSESVNGDANGFPLRRPGADSERLLPLKRDRGWRLLPAMSPPTPSPAPYLVHTMPHVPSLSSLFIYS